MYKLLSVRPDPYVAAVYGWKTLQDNLVQVK